MITQCSSLLLVAFLTGCGTENMVTDLTTEIDTAISAPRSLTLTSVVDGDTLDFGDLRCRINGIDTPETYMTQTLLYSSEYCQMDVATIQLMGEAAKATAQQFLSIGSEYMVKVVEEDAYGRSVCQVELPNGNTFAEEMIAAGYAVVLEQYLDDVTADFYIKNEEGAARSEAGLWYFYPEYLKCLSD